MKIWLFIVCVSMIMILILSVRIHVLKYEKKIDDTYMEMMDEMYRSIEERVEFTRRFRHDLKNHIATIEMLTEREKPEDPVPDMIPKDKLISCYEKMNTARYCRDDFVDAVVGIKADICRQENIPIDINIEDALYNDIDSLSLAAVLYNILDNAVEASLEIDEIDKRHIDLNIGRTDDSINIDCSNRVKNAKAIDFTTRKSSRIEHGMGLKIIRSIVEKNNGSHEISIDKNADIYSIHISMKASAEGQVDNNADM